MLRLLKRLRTSVEWRARRVLRFLWHTEDVAFWAGDADDAPWYPDLAKLHEIARSVGFDTRKATERDLELLRDYHERVGRPLGPRRTRKMRERWAAGDDCYVATDRKGDVAAYIWAGYRDHYIEAVRELLPLGPHEMVLYDVDTRRDKRGSMGFLACSCAALAEGIRRGRSCVISWSTPQLFEEFRRAHWFSGLGTLRLLRLERCRCRFGVLSRRALEIPDDDARGQREADAS